MKTNILPFKKPNPSGAEPWMPSLEEMCTALRKNFSKLDQGDRVLYCKADYTCWLGDRAEIDSIIECRAIAWSMMARNGISL